MTALPKPKYTLEEYFELEQKSEGWFEYFDGEVFEMSGVHPRHASIETNLITSLTIKTSSRGCKVFPSNLRLKVPTLPPYRYPDLSALCGEPKFETINGLPCLLNPSLIIEILSPSTEAFDKDEKFKGYKSIPSFREYILISQNSKDITHYLKQSDRFWLRGDYTEGEAFRIETLDCELSVEEIYQGINFESETGF